METLLLTDKAGAYTYLYLNTQIFVFVFENPQDEIFVFISDWRIWVYLTNIFLQIHFSFVYFNTTEIDNPPNSLYYLLLQYAPSVNMFKLCNVNRKIVVK